MQSNPESASCTIMSVWLYVKPTASSKINSELNLLPYAAMSKRSDHPWYSLARWTTVARGDGGEVLQFYSMRPKSIWQND